jgi:hypothetical protein
MSLAGANNIERPSTAARKINYHINTPRAIKQYKTDLIFNVVLVGNFTPKSPLVIS